MFKKIISLIFSFLLLVNVANAQVKKSVSIAIIGAENSDQMVIYLSAFGNDLQRIKLSADNTIVVPNNREIWLYVPYDKDKYDTLLIDNIPVYERTVISLSQTHNEYCFWVVLNEQPPGIHKVEFISGGQSFFFSIQAMENFETNIVKYCEEVKKIYEFLPRGYLIEN